jgi:hypothetical protein
MIEKQMLRLMLNKTFYTKYKGSISPTIFSVSRRYKRSSRA